MDSNRPRANSVSNAVLARRKVPRHVTFTEMSQSNSAASADPEWNDLDVAPREEEEESGPNGSGRAKASQKDGAKNKEWSPKEKLPQGRWSPKDGWSPKDRRSPSSQPAGGSSRSTLHAGASRPSAVHTVGGSRSTPSLPRMSPLVRFRSHPHGLAMGESPSLDGVLSRRKNSAAQLPAFNKRPLTDTPVVSGMASPITREQSSDEENDESVRKNISHLSLADLNAVSAAVRAKSVRFEKEMDAQDGSGYDYTNDNEHDHGYGHGKYKNGYEIRPRRRHHHKRERSSDDLDDIDVDSDADSNTDADVDTDAATDDDTEVEQDPVSSVSGAPRLAAIADERESISPTNTAKVTAVEPQEKPSFAVSPAEQEQVQSFRRAVEPREKQIDRALEHEIERERKESVKEIERRKSAAGEEISTEKAGAPETGLGSAQDAEEPETSAEAAPLHQIKRDLLQEVPPELQQQFQKTPSFEKLKDMLLSRPFARSQKAYTLNIAGQTSSKTSPDGRIASVDVGSKLVIVMVGLPARGKSYITNKLTRYLNWLQHDCRVFNVGNTRRMDKTNVLGPASRPLPDTATPSPHSGRSPALNALSPAQKASPAEPLSPTSHSANFFNPENKESTEIREKWAMDTLDALLNWVIDGPGSVGILDATNSTKKRRLKVLKRIQERSNGELKVLFLESICSDPAILDTNIRLKLSGPDYKDMDPELALKDFIGRLHNYERAYETIDESEEHIPGFQYVKMIDVGKKVVSYNIQGFLASQTIYFLLNFNLCERQIWLTRHGESVDNLSGRIGGDSPLTKRGQHFAKTLTRFLNYQRREFRRKQLESFSSRLELRYNELSDKATGKTTVSERPAMQIPTETSFCVWTSMLLRAVETGNYFNEQEYNIKAMRMLNELGGGKFEGMTYDEIRRKHPKEFESRLRNKLTYRYPGVGGESYLDVMVRLRPLINEIERTTDHLLIVSHRVVLRVLLAYFLNLGKSAIVDLDVPLHTLYCLESKPYGTEYAMYEYDEAADWFKKVEPEHQKNVREVGVNFRERKYSVVPTAPPTSHRSKEETNRSKDEKALSNFSLRQSLAAADPDQEKRANLSSSRKLADLSKMRKP
ncbi:putative 6-phosphofructo-2-kinase [Clavispora lusitaniae]|uniref:6-phosphofructo-2-kinase n=1 Tax=Clavispora lusitaniae TaxID=36911 RepID=A0ACD0WQT7_CLALS|nr:putative 6-phosphofructo-2-kinase [Clavispora lusitaniae]QFZ35410.1 putative 6-phosphofructo-2-kinase [Clavispora lusitaniae]QFZ41104.1 putative 6-phosphofructo-2-kinase [Clavispora lusitaniae]QFZ46785.1 putative 6-phosphofructo-2-kinase [Clavispora lusitaniae]QFZ52450.1 putative 6-phosphofructo-2-kinase [Clavispora lusitaniae]